MSANPKKWIAPTLVSGDVPTVTKAFEAAAHKKNPLENAADMIAMRYGISEEAPKIDEAVFQQNRAIGKKVVPLKEYFEQTAKAFVQKEAEKKEEAARKKREYAKLTLSTQNKHAAAKPGRIHSGVRPHLFKRGVDCNGGQSPREGVQVKNKESNQCNQVKQFKRIQRRINVCKMKLKTC